MFEKLLDNPEQYRIGGNYRATHIVFPVEFKGKKYVIKKPRTSAVSSLVQSYYSLQGNKIKNSAKFGLLREIKQLQKLNGFYSPKIHAFDQKNPVLVREYLEGRDFRVLSSDEYIKKTLGGALKAMQEIHQRDLIIGDTHVKNTFLTEEDQVYWIDFDGVFDEDNITRTKAQDLLKFVYSAYTSTRDRNKTLYAAELVARNYQQGEVRDNLQELVNSLEPGFRLWFQTRLPLDGKIHREITMILSR